MILIFTLLYLYNYKKKEPIPLIDNGEDGPIRCRRCKGYINPGVAFIDGGRRFICNLCKCDNIGKLI